jgi:3-oxoacyl-(acyl-carrier-protein) synthase/NADPH:quinone reductase-like Zn-dependent oxidoreductase/acyl carrier protein
MANESTARSQEKETLLALRALRQRVDELEGAAREPIAIVGMSCRFPGGADSPEQYWNLLQQKRSAIREIPEGRIALDSFFDSHPQTPGKTYSRSAGLLDAPGEFDAEFFGISPREAVSLDPQQRLLLEVSWEALENAAINPRSLSGQNVGVFVGITTSEYAQLLQKTVPAEELGAYVLQGSALNASAGRLSYFYGVNGPSMAIDTACSSSLVAVDRACRSLREGETTLAIAAGVNLLAVPESLIIGSQWGMLSASGEVRAFDAMADGFVRGEGCGVVVLKRLSLARAAGDRILGLILGSAVNQDGASSGLTVPNGLAQQALLREAHRRAGIEPWQVGYVEAHGTGTALGDPIEAEALGAVFGNDARNSGKLGRSGKLLIGSVKSNAGHLESAAGVAGLIKVALSLRHETIPGQLHWTAPSPHVRWDELGLEVATEARAWEPIGNRRIGGVSSFGFSGTNAHVVLESWTEPAEETTEVPEEPRPEVLVVTARSEAALRELAARYADCLAETESGWSAICWTAAVGRAVFGERLAVVASDKIEATRKLRAWLGGQSISGVYRGQFAAGRRTATAALGPKAGIEEVASGFARGEAVDWAQRFAGRRLSRVELPAYAFQRERYWVEPSERDESGRAENGRPTGRGMLGRRLRSAGVRGQFEVLLSESSWVGEHRVDGVAVLPATGHLELMLEAGAETFGPGCALEDLALLTPLMVAGERSVQTVVELESGGRSRVRVFVEEARGAEDPGGAWQVVSEGWLRPATGDRPEPIDVQKISARLGPPMSGDSLYAQLEARGLGFGESFRGVERLWAGGGEVLGEIAAPARDPAWQIAPWWLDACLQVAGLANDFSRDGLGDGELYLPTGLDRLEIYGQTEGRCWSHVATRRVDPDTVAADLTIADSDGHVILTCRDLGFRKFQRKTPARTAIYGVDWLEMPAPPAPFEFRGRWVVLAGDDFGVEVCRELTRLGADCWLISPDAIESGDIPAYRLNGRDRNGCREILRTIAGTNKGIEGIIDLRPASAGDLFQEAGSDGPQCIATIDACLALLQALLREQIRPAIGVWLITRWAREMGSVFRSPGFLSLSPIGCAIQALRRTAAAEFPELVTSHLELDHAADASALLRALCHAGEPEVLLRGDRQFVPRLMEHATAKDDNTELVPAETGRIEDLRTIPSAREAIGDDEVEIEVHTHGINFRDVMTALDMLPGTLRRLGGECAGVVVKAGSLSGFAAGQRVFAFAPASFRRFVTVKGTNVAHVPEGLSLAQAAALPVVYLTALYGLDTLAGLRSGRRVLIHSAAGGLGMAAINAAKARGAEIYATAGTEEKRAYLRSIGIQHVLPSRTAEFADEVMRLTEGCGVDVALNSLTGALAEGTLSVVSKGGCFLEVGKRNTLSADRVRELRPDVRHFIYDLGEAAGADASLVPSLQRKMLAAFAAGEMAPLPVTEFTDAGEALRYLAQARHIGKVVVTRPDAAGAFGLQLGAHSTYLITGGYGSLGLLFAGMLVERGARHLVLVGRNPPSSVADEAIARMRACGAEVRLAIADVGDRRAMERILREIPPKFSLKGILHTAGVLDDRSLLEQGPETLANAIRPKVQGAWNLHLLTRDLQLDFFVLFSSAAVLLGSPGQANYVVANALEDALATYRRGLGLPALSIQWGPWSSSGMTRQLKLAPEAMGLASISLDEGFATLEELLAGGETVAAVFRVSSWKKFVSSRRAAKTLLSLLTETGSGAPNLGTPNLGTSAPAAEQSSPQSPAFLMALTAARDAERPAILVEHLRQLTAQILSLPAKTVIDEDEALHDLGLDSLMAVEMRNALAASLGRELPPTMVLDYPTLRTLTGFLLRELFADGSLAHEGQEFKGIGAMSESEIGAISENEAEALLLAELRKR